MLEISFLLNWPCLPSDTETKSKTLRGRNVLGLKDTHTWVQANTHRETLKYIKIKLI